MEILRTTHTKVQQNPKKSVAACSTVLATTFAAASTCAALFLPELRRLSTQLKVTIAGGSAVIGAALPALGYGAYKGGSRLRDKIGHHTPLGDAGVEEGSASESRSTNPPNDPLYAQEVARFKALKATWVLDNPESEVERLRGRNIFSTQIKETIDQAFEEEKRDQATILLGRALEIRALYQDTHYVFVHGQGEVMNVITTLVGQLVRQFHPHERRRLFKHLRTPDQAYAFSNINEFFSLYDEESPNFDDTRYSVDLLSVNAHWCSSDMNESCLSFLSQNRNVIDGFGTRKNILTIVEQLLKPYIGNPQACEKYVNGHGGDCL